MKFTAVRLALFFTFFVCFFIITVSSFLILFFLFISFKTRIQCNIDNIEHNNIIIRISPGLIHLNSG